MGVAINLGKILPLSCWTLHKIQSRLEQNCSQLVGVTQRGECLWMPMRQDLIEIQNFKVSANRSNWMFHGISENGTHILNYIKWKPNIILQYIQRFVRELSPLVFLKSCSVFSLNLVLLPVYL